MVPQRPFWERWKKQAALQSFVWPGILFILIFSYIPMYGIVIAFQDYTVVDQISNSKWVGLDKFAAFLNDQQFWRAVGNTIAISIGKLAIGFPAPIILALLLNELRARRFKKFTQTVSYLPHFLSWVILGGMLVSWLATDGILNQLLMALGVIQKPIAYLVKPDYYWAIAVLSEVWKEMGWGTILYLAAMSGIDPTLYEAAKVDGAKRLQQVWHITLPSIRGIIALMLVLAVGGLLGSNLDQALVLQRPLNLKKSEVIDSFVFKLGIQQGDFSYATAVGLFTSVIALGLILFTNFVTRKLNDRSIF
ncbi:MAG: ABC transporter permease subunit [Spirochaetales bacterium]